VGATIIGPFAGLGIETGVSTLANVEEARLSYNSPTLERLSEEYASKDGFYAAKYDRLRNFMMMENCASAICSPALPGFVQVRADLESAYRQKAKALGIKEQSWVRYLPEYFSRHDQKKGLFRLEYQHELIKLVNWETNHFRQLRALLEQNGNLCHGINTNPPAPPVVVQEIVKVVGDVKVSGQVKVRHLADHDQSKQAAH
jgi:hypothetical protein